MTAVATKGKRKKAAEPAETPAPPHHQQEQDDDAKGREVTRIVTPETLGTVQPPAAAEPVTPPAPPASAADAFAAVFNRGELLAALQTVRPVAKDRSPKPVLACCLLRAEGGKVIAEATDLQRSVRVVLSQVQVESAGAAAVPCGQLLEVVGELESDTVEVRTDQRGRVAVRGGDSLIHTPGRPASEWPGLEAEVPKGAGKVAGADLLQLFKRTAFSVDRDVSDWRSGLRLEADGKTLRAIACDGRRLALAECPCAGPKLPPVLIPLAAVDALNKAVGEDEDVGYWAEESAALFGGVNWAFRTALLAANFPNYLEAFGAELFPPVGLAPQRRLTAKRAALLSAVRRAMLAVDAERSTAEMHLGPEGLRMEARRTDGTAATVPFPCQYEGEPLLIGANAAFLRQGLESFAADEVTIDFTEHFRPMTARVAGEAGYVYLLMPVNVREG